MAAEGGAEKVGQNSAHEFDVTDLLRAGAGAAPTVLAVRVHNVMNWTLGDCLDGKMNDLQMGGLIGSVRLETRAASWLDEVYVRPDFSATSGSYERVTVLASAVVRGADLPPGAALRLGVDGSTEAAAPKWALVRTAERVSAGSTVNVSVVLDAPKLWSPSSPALHVATLSLGSGSGSDAIKVRFGIREVATEHGRFLLNGKPLFISGYQSNFQYGEHEYGFPDLEHYKKRLMVAKEMGFNAVR